MVATAIIGGAIVGGGASIIAGGSAAGAQRDAAETAAETQTNALAAQGVLNEPYRMGGIVGQNELLSQLGLVGDPEAEGFGALMEPFDPSGIEMDPGYEFRRDEGTDAVARTYAGAGKFLSGAALKGINRYGQNFASNEYQNAYNNAFNRYQTNRANQLNPLQFLTTTGQAAAAGQAANVGNTATNIANLQTGVGNVNAANAINTGNAIGNAASSIGNYAVYNSMMPGVTNVSNYASSGGFGTPTF